MKLRSKKTGGLSNSGLANIMGEQDFFRVYTDAGWKDYYSLAELNEEWEDVRAPLITTNRVRELLKNWADYNDIDEVDVSKDAETGLVSFYNGFTYIDFYVHEPFVKEGEHYTIAELCEGA